MVVYIPVQSCTLREDCVQPVSVDMSDWIRFWQMAEKQRYRVNVFPPACSAAEPQEAGGGGEQTR